MNKVFTRAVLAAVLAGAGATQADTEQGEQLRECKQQLAAIYGEDVRVRINGSAAVGESTLNLRVYPKGERLLRVSCARSADGGLEMLDRHGMALVLPEQNGEELTAL